MYSLSRLLLLIAVIAGIYSAALLVILGWPQSAMVVAFCLFVKHRYGRRQRLTTLGSADWAQEPELRAAGMVGASTGLILGRYPNGGRRNFLSAIQKPFSSRLTAPEACHEFWGGWRPSRGPVIRLPQAIHSAIFSPSGGGKGVSCIIPFLRTCSDSVIVVDPKGENAMLTAAHRRRAFGHQIVLLDAYHVVSKKSDCFNPLDTIREDHPNAIDSCRDLAKSLIVRTGEEKDPHWNDSAEITLTGAMMTTVYYGRRETGRSVHTAKNLVTPENFEKTVAIMRSSEACGGKLAQRGNQLLNYVGNERASMMTTMSRHLEFLDTPAIEACTSSSSFDPTQLRRGKKMTIYLILPPEHMEAQAGLMRMWIAALLRAIVTGGPQEKHKVHLVLDEAAALGALPAIDNAISQFRGYGLRMQFYYQSKGQLKTCYPKDGGETLLANTTQSFFGVHDYATAEYISNMLDEETILVESGGTNSGWSKQSTQAPQTQNSNSQSGGSSRNWQQQARKLLKPGEVMALSPRTAITFTPGVRPVMTTLMRYYEERNLGQRGLLGRMFAACFTLAASIVLCAFSVTVAVGLTRNPEVRGRIARISASKVSRSPNVSEYQWVLPDFFRSTTPGTPAR